MADMTSLKKLVANITRTTQAWENQPRDEKGRWGSTGGSGGGSRKFTHIPEEEGMSLEKLAHYEPLNEIDVDTVEGIKKAIIDGTFDAPPILIWNDEIMTGSHRVVAADELRRYGDKLDYDDPLARRLYDYRIPTLDVSSIMDEYMEKHPGHEVEYDFLRRYFKDTKFEVAIKENKEW